MMSKMTTSGATGYFVEYAGSAIRNLTMEGRLTLVTFYRNGCTWGDGCSGRSDF